MTAAALTTSAIITPSTPALALYTPIHAIQGASHVSPMVGSVVPTFGIVTAVAGDGFFMQEPTPDADPATSEGIFVATPGAPSVSVGDGVGVSATVAEVRVGGATSLSNTELTNPMVTHDSSGNVLPSSTVIGVGGRVPPTAVIDDDATGDVETSGTFDPATDGIDFYESLEGMRVQVNDPVAVGPTSADGQIWVVGDGGSAASVRTARGGVVASAGDSNPERVLLDDAFVGLPAVNVGDGFTTPAVGVLDHASGNFKVDVTAALTRVDHGLARETTATPAPGELAVATLDVNGIAATAPQGTFDHYADIVVANLRSPDLVALVGVQDDDGATNDSVVSAGATLDKLVATITAAGGPQYEWTQIDPADDQDGGVAGGNTRVAFLYRTDRGLAFIDRAGGTATAATAVVSSPGGPELSASPGRVAPTDPAWTNSAKALAGEFTYRDTILFVVGTDLVSAAGAQPSFGHFQPPVDPAAAQRQAQAQMVNTFVDSILASDPGAGVIVLGNLSDSDYSATATTLAAGALHNLTSSLVPAERYDSVVAGNSEAPAQMLVSSSLFATSPAVDAVHVDAEFAGSPSDSDPLLARIAVNPGLPGTNPEYVPVVPDRLLETRPNYGLVGYQGPKPVAGQTVEVQVTGVGTAKVPDDAKAVVLNVTGVEPDLAGFVTVWPCGTPRPLASNLNLAGRVITPNLVVSKLGVDGKVCIYTQNSAHLVVDINGYMPATSSFVPLVPDRILDTREGPGQIGYTGGQPAADSTVELKVTGAGSSQIPADAKAVILNVTGVDPNAAGYLTVWPCGTPRPVASNVNLTGGVITPNAVVSKIGVDGKVCLYTQNGADLVADVNGYAPANSTYVPVVPARVLETRSSIGQIGYSGVKPPPEATIELPVTGVGSAQVPADADAVVLNVTGADVDIDGFVTVWPCGVPRPNASNLNLAHGVINANAVIAKIGAGGKVCLFTQNGANLIVDINGYIP